MKNTANHKHGVGLKIKIREKKINGDNLKTIQETTEGWSRTPDQTEEIVVGTKA